MKIKEIETSRINEVDFTNLEFGAVFTDHMFSCDYINGEWVNLKLFPINPLALVLHQEFSLWSSLF